MDKNDLLALFHKELRYEAQTAGYIREETEYVVRHISKHREKGFIIASNVNEHNAVKVIQDELAYYRSRNEQFEWKVYSYDSPSNLKDLLAQQGFEVEPEEALMVLELHEKHPLLTSPLLGHLKEITDLKGIQQLIALEDAIWEESHAELEERLWRDKQDNPDCLFLYGIHENEQLVSGAWMYLERNSSFASMWGGSTLPDFRGKGYYTSLLAIRAQKAYVMGHPFLTVDASPMSKPILEKYGFSCLAMSYGCQSPDH